jgi:tripeptide aminopeptidase
VGVTGRQALGPGRSRKSRKPTISPCRSAALPALSCEVLVIDSRSAGELQPVAHILQVIRAVDAHLGNVAQVQRASTDANIPLSLGREAIAIGGGAHTLQEWFDCTGRELGLKRILLTLLALAGV